MANKNVKMTKRELLRKLMEDKQAIIDCIEKGENISATLKEKGIKLA